MAVIEMRSYKIAKKFTEDSTSFMRIIELATQGLSQYNHYKPIANILHELATNKQVLEAHLESAKKILAKKEVIYGK